MTMCLSPDKMIVVLTSVSDFFFLIGLVTMH